MSDRHRALPTWMSNKDKVTEKKKEPLRQRSKRKCARSVFYCMNEEELVQAAAACLTGGGCGDQVVLRTGRQVAEKSDEVTVKTREEPAHSGTRAKSVTEESSDCGDAQETTYISETDLDITEVETVPYAESRPRRSPEGQRSGPVQDPAELEPDEREEPPSTSAEEDDDLRLVREIFFN